MKYLRKIFERLTDDEYYELKEECETYLAYLLDDEFALSAGNATTIYPLEVIASLTNTTLLLKVNPF